MNFNFKGHTLAHIMLNELNKLRSFDSQEFIFQKFTIGGRI